MQPKKRAEAPGDFRLTTNNRMEMHAAIKGLELLQKPRKVTLYSDSKYLAIFGAEGDSMKPHHMKMQAVGGHRVAAELARHSAGRVCNRLFQPGFSSQLTSTPGVMPDLLTFRPFATLRPHPRISRIEKSIR